MCAVNMAMHFTRMEVPLYVYMTGEATISGTPSATHPWHKRDKSCQAPSSSCVWCVGRMIGVADYAIKIAGPLRRWPKDRKDKAHFLVPTHG